MTFSYLPFRRHSRYCLSSVLSKFTHKKLIQMSPGAVRLPLVTPLCWVGKVHKRTRRRLMQPLKLVSFACAEWRGTALSPTGRWLAVYWGPFRRQQSNDRLSDNYGCSVLFDRTACWPIMRYRVNVAVNWVCAWRAVYTCTISYDLWAPR